MPRRLPPLAALRAFEATARLGSVTRAAGELGRTHGAVSRQIQALQEAAGLPLFEKAGTGLRLNADGEALHRSVAAALDGLEAGWTALREAAGGPALHVACSASFAMRWLVPRLPGLYRAHPTLRLRLSMTTARALRHEGADLVIAWNRGHYPPGEQARAIPLGTVAFGPVCAPDYLVQAGSGRLAAATRIAHEHVDRAWTMWAERAGRVLEWRDELRFPHTHLCIEAALAGLGLALVEQRLVREELTTGRLRAPCGFVPFPEGLAALPTSPRAASPSVRAFLDWLRDTLD